MFRKDKGSTKMGFPVEMAYWTAMKAFPWSAVGHLQVQRRYDVRDEGQC